VLLAEHARRTPFRQIRSCIVASASASFNCSFSARIRRSAADPVRPAGPGSMFSNPT
jgi:hypothetical protein